MNKKIVRSDEEWRKVLSNEQYNITRKKDTEPAFSGKYYNFFEHGLYKCICCNNELFNSKSKYHSGSGWPSFWEPESGNSIETTPDYSHGMNRTEVKCRKCDAHLGHVFNDGPPPTGLRYCINSASLSFEKD